MQEIKILFIEDDEDDYILVRDLLEEISAVRFFLTWVATYKEACEEIERGGYDICLLDYRLGAYTGLDILREITAKESRLPVIILTGQGDYASDIKAMHAGAVDYLVKGQINGPLLERTIRYTIERRRTEEALRESEKRFAMFMRNLPGLAYIKDKTGHLIFLNEYAENAHGWKISEVLGQTDVELWPPAMAAKREADSREIFLSGKAIERIDEIDQNGRLISYLTKEFPILHEGAQPLLGGISIDITKRKQAEEHIHLLSQELMKAQESERHKLGRDLHDVVGQDLLALKLGIEELLEDADLVGKARGKLEALLADLNRAHQGVRDMAHQLRPGGLDLLGLTRSVRQHCREFANRHNIKVAFLAAGIDENKLDFDLKINLFRIIQESLNNAVKHARARNISIRLISSSPNIILRIEDDGRGFDVQTRMQSAAQEKRMGLRSMEERAALLKGRFRIESRLDQGTKIFVTIPTSDPTDSALPSSSSDNSDALEN